MIAPTSEKPLRKIAQVRQRIRAVAAAAGTGAKLPTVRNLCTSCSASLSTIDRALQDLEAQGVLERRHGSGIYVCDGAGNSRICLLMGSDVMTSHEVSPFYPALLSRLTDISRERHWEVSPHIASVAVAGQRRNEVSRELRYALEAGFIDGLVTTISLPADISTCLADNNVPVAPFLPTARRPSTIGVDYRSLTRLGVQELAASGRRRIALITVLGFAHATGFTDDLDGYADGMRQCGFTLRPEYAIAAPDQPRLLSEATGARWKHYGAEAMRRLLELPEPPDAVVVTDDMAAMGVLQVLAERTADVQIASHANRGTSSTQLLESHCIALEFDPLYIADRLLALLDDMLHQRPDMLRNELIGPQVVRPA